MALIDRLLGDNSETSGSRVGETEQGGTRSRDEETREEGTTRLGQTGTRETAEERREAAEREQRQERTAEQTRTAEQEQRSRGTSTEVGTERGRETREGTRIGTEQQTGALERILQAVTQNREQNRQTGSQRGTDVVDALGETSSVVENLDQASRDTLANLLQRFSGEGSALESFVDMLGDRVGASQQRIAAQNADILAATERRGQRDIGASRTRLAAAAGGSTRNSLVEATAAELQNDLQLNLAGLEAQLDQQARAEEREEIDQVLRGFGTQGSVAQQVASTLAQGRQVAREQQFSQERGHQTLESLVDSLTASESTQQTRENALNTLATLSQEQLLDTIHNVRETDRQAVTDSVLTGETTEQTQTEEATLLSELANTLSQSQNREVSDQEVMEIVERLTQESSDEVYLNEGRAAEATTGEISDDFNLRDLFDFVSGLGSS